MEKTKNRLFLAVPAILYDYEKIKADLAGSIRGRWVPSGNLHLTLSFFGDRFKREELLSRLEPLMRKIDATEITGLGFFKHNRILYAKAESLTLEELHTNIAWEFDLPVKQGFVGHITLMRIKKIYDIEVFRQKISSYDGRVIGKLEPRLELLQSHLFSDGARYESIKIYS